MTVRSGKDYISAIVLTECIKACNHDTLNLIGAVSSAMALTIVGDYIRKYLNIPKVGKYNNLDCITFKHGRYTHRILFSGGAKVSSQDSIQGLTLQNIYLTEANLLHETFIAQCFNRIANSDNPKIFFTLNPMGEKHWFYTKYLDLWTERNELYPSNKMLNYEHVTIMDNPSMTQEKFDRFIEGLDPDSVFYKRNVLGLRISAEGVIYNIRDYNYLDDKTYQYKDYAIVADPGINKSGTYFCLAGLTWNEESKQNEMHILKEYFHRNADVTNQNDIKMPLDYAKDLVTFYKESATFAGRAIRNVIIDRDVTFFRELNNEFKNNNINTLFIKYAIKNKIEERIKLGINLLYSAKLKFSNNMITAIEHFKNATYESKSYEDGKLERFDDPSISNIDAVDGIEYIMTYWENTLYSR